MTPSLFPSALPGDLAARQRALDPAASFVVQAPAGSGKTELLTQRFLRLLSLVDAPEEIVAITFTRKAAAEMRGRVLAALESARNDAPCEPHQRTTRQLALDALARDGEARWDILAHPARLRIETIDALAHSITRAMPWIARFGAMPEPIEDARDLHRQAAARTVHLLGTPGEGGQAVRQLLEHLDCDVPRAERLLAELLERREQWLPLVATTDRRGLRARLERNLAQQIEEDLASTRNEAPTWLRPYLPPAEASELPRWKEIVDFLVKKDGGWYLRPSKDVPAFVKALLPQLNRDSNEPLRERLAWIRRLPPDRYEDRQWATLDALFPVLLHAAANLRAIFQNTGQVDFAEIAQAALHALGPVTHPTDFAFALFHRVRHFLVDEFQDTSDTQHELLLRLTAGWEHGDGRTLFLVGDPMQSIYRFRQAEVGLFLDVRRNGLGSLALEPLTLEVNFRSGDRVVDWVNTAFEAIFPERDDPSAGAVRYERATPFPGRHPGTVTLHPLLDQKQGFERDEAKLVARLVEQARQEDPDQEIGILVRARPHLLEILSEFRRLNWRYRAVKVDALADSSTVRDLVALTRAIVHLADRPAWLAVLRAPWCGFTLSDLHAVAGRDLKSTVWTLMNSPAAGISPDGSFRLARIRAALEPVLSQRRRLPLRAWVETAWARLGGPACASSKQERADAQIYFELIEQFDDGGDLPDFDWLEKRLTELYTEPDPLAGPTLQVMPIHQAKGLEFDTVILAGLGQRGKTDDKPLLAVLEDQDRLLMAPLPTDGTGVDPLYDFLDHVESRKQKAELRRLLYVGATRARTHLHLIGHTTIKKDGSLAKPVSGSLLGYLWPAVEDEFQNKLGRGTAAPAPSIGPALEPPASPSISRLPSSWQPPASPPGLTRRPALTEEPVERVTFGWVGDTLRHAGVVAHRYVQTVAKEGVANWTAARITAEYEGIRRAVEAEGVPQAECAHAAEIVERALRAITEDPRGRWILDAHAESESETAWTGTVNGRIVRARVDRTFIDEAGDRWIIDFKTGTHEGTDIEEFLDAERERYRSQMEIYARLLGQLDGRRVRAGLYFPLLRGWRELDIE